MNIVDVIPQEHIRYMQRALELAALGIGEVAPNPLVGAVLVHQGRIIGEGYHHRWGQAHAEVMAIGSVKPEDVALLSESILYVTLEPCSHHGKTPPCAELIIQKGIPHVVIALSDPFPEVSGRGIKKLEEAGIKVELGCLAHEAYELNKAFNTAHTQGRPFVSLKWAESADGFIDTIRVNRREKAFRFSSDYRQRIVHRYRRAHQAILVGAGTAEMDNPSLTNRYWSNRQPIRIVVATHLPLDRALNLFSDGLAPTWVLYNAKYDEAPNTEGMIRYIPLTEISAIEILRVLKAEGIHSIYVEGGSRTIQMFIDEGLYDHIEYERSRQVLKRGIVSPTISR